MCMAEKQTFFDDIFSNAKATAIIVMDDYGIIDRVNTAFTTAYGYSSEDLKTKHFRILYVEKDQLTRRPEIELNVVHREGSSMDENYLVHKNGTPIWVTGESILVKTKDGSCIIKIIHNIHAQKQLERYLLSTSELLDSLFESVQQSGLLILDPSLKVVKMNGHFKRMFNVTDPISEGAKLQQIPHPFWNSEELKNDLRNALVTGSSLKKDYVTDVGNQVFDRLHITSKTIIGEDGSDKRLLLMIKEDR
jgi:PAS domain S-box-containing protein